VSEGSPRTTAGATTMQEAIAVTMIVLGSVGVGVMLTILIGHWRR